MAQKVKNLPAMQQTQVLYLGWEDPLEKEMATHSSILALEIPWTEEPGGLRSPWGPKESDMTEVTEFSHKGNFYFLFLCSRHWYDFCINQRLSEKPQ